MTQAGVWMLVLFALYWMGQHTIKSLRCAYCGEVRGHEPQCPFNMDREER